MKFLFSLFAFIILAESCNSSVKAIEPTNLKTSNKVQNTLSGSYIITQIGDHKSISQKLSITFDDKLNKVNGFAGCNSFFGDYTVQNNEITFGMLAASKKYCQEEIMTAESQLLKALSTAQTFVIKDDMISFKSGDTILLEATKSASSEKSEVVRGNYGTAITYKLTSRGLFEYLNITESTISFSNDSGLRAVKNYSCNEKDWSELKSLIDAVDLEKFQKLEAPTNNRSTDSALSANLAIQIGDVYYMAPEFDHGNPPEEIEVLVNKVLSIKENTVKQ